jgi:hypothetical protein
MPGRRTFLKAAAATLAAAWMPSRTHALQMPGTTVAKQEGEILPAWEPGVLEIHQIDTGRGNAALVLGPDGTSLLIDAGETHSDERALSPARPDSSRRAGEWITRYVRRQLDRIKQTDLDLMLFTHLHGDHVGEVTASSPQSAHGNYKLTGAADVAEKIRVHELIDRGWPDYNYPEPPRDQAALNYIALARGMATRGARVRRAQAGSLEQLALRHDAAGYSHFSARILSVNGEVWTGIGENSKAMFPPVNGLTGTSLPSENMCCVSLRLQYGAFRYYSGGDLIGDTGYGSFPWHDIETPVAEAAGPVSVAVANHHGYFDACGPAVVRALRPRAWVVPTWHLTHPAMNVIANMVSTEIYPGERTIFVVNMAPATRLMTDRFASNFASTDGHVVVRVPPAGDTFTVYAVNARDELGSVVKTFGPFAA